VVIHALLALLACQLAGEALVRVSGLPLPGPVAGLVLLTVGLMARGRCPAALESTAGGLLSHMSLLFVPAGVGIMLHGERLRDDWLPLGAAVAVSTVLTIAATATVFRLVSRALGGGGAAAGAESGTEEP
jgi:holin-like protein